MLRVIYIIQSMNKSGIAENPSSSQGDFEAVKAINSKIKNSTVTALGRAEKSDLDTMYESLKTAENPMKEALGKVVVQIQYKERFYYGKAIDNDVMKASALALENSLNKIALSVK